MESGPRPVTATRVWLELGESPTEEPEVAESEEQVEEPGFLDMLAEAEEAVQLLARAMEEITVVFEGLPVYNRRGDAGDG